MGACTFTPDPDGYAPLDPNRGWAVTGTVFLSASYATGGDTLTAAQLGLGRIKQIQIDAIGPYDYAYNATTGKVQAFWTGAALSGVLAEVTATTNLSAIPAQVEAWG